MFTNFVIDDEKVFKELETINNKRFPLIKLSDYFKQHFEKVKDRVDGQPPKQLYTIGDAIHPNVYGASIAAEALAKIIDK